MKNQIKIKKSNVQKERKKGRMERVGRGKERRRGGRKAAMNEIMGQRFVTGSILRNIEKNYFVL